MRDISVLEISGGRAPAHVAIIMDGNGRWAKRKGLPRIMGHRAGAERLREIVEASVRNGIEYLTVFAFSTENWRRSKSEVEGLMNLFRIYSRSEANSLNSNGIRVRFIGDRSELEPRVYEAMAKLESATENNSKLCLTVAINYGGRDDIARAAKRLARAAADGKIDPDLVNEGYFAAMFDTGFLPDPDLVVRTSGEMRISNFLIWQSAYAEFAFVDTLWPDFTAERFETVLESYSRRDRRFGAAAS
ncbi:MAG: polyprenyl diphosphate synthase [Albidovulum sp.]|nr:polyprenyl diphosphate synthase [Albidovulum sp.]